MGGVWGVCSVPHDHAHNPRFRAPLSFWRTASPTLCQFQSRPSYTVSIAALTTQNRRHNLHQHEPRGPRPPQQPPRAEQQLPPLRATTVGRQEDHRAQGGRYDGSDEGEGGHLHPAVRCAECLPKGVALLCIAVVPTVVDVRVVAVVSVDVMMD